jgi:hypothetical protein
LNLTLDLETHQHLGSLKHVINIIMWIRDMGCYNPYVFLLDALAEVRNEETHLHNAGLL